MKSQAHIWYPPKQIRELQRNLERQATLLLRADRRRRDRVPNRAVNNSAPPIESPDDTHFLILQH